MQKVTCNSNNILKNTTVFNNNTYRLYIPFRKYIGFENILKKLNVDYSIDFEMPNSLTDFVRFYFDKRDQILINQLLIENKIEATDDFYVPADYEEGQKTFYFYLKFVGTLLFCVFIYYLIHIFFINSH